MDEKKQNNTEAAENQDVQSTESSDGAGSGQQTDNVVKEDVTASDDNAGDAKAEEAAEKETEAPVEEASEAEESPKEDAAVQEAEAKEEAVAEEVPDEGKSAEKKTKEKAVVEFPDFSAGDTITVHYKIREGNKERIQQFQGTVLQRRGSGSTATFTVRKISSGIGVERIFPVASPFLEKIVLNRRGKVRRARIFYLRGRQGKATRIRERR